MCGIELEELEIMEVVNDLIFQLVRWKSIFVIQLCNVSVEIYVIYIYLPKNSFDLQIPI